MDADLKRFFVTGSIVALVVVIAFFAVGADQDPGWVLWEGPAGEAQVVRKAEPLTLQHTFDPPGAAGEVGGGWDSEVPAGVLALGFTGPPNTTLRVRVGGGVDWLDEPVPLAEATCIIGSANSTAPVTNATLHLASWTEDGSCGFEITLDDEMGHPGTFAVLWTATPEGGRFTSALEMRAEHHATGTV